MTRRKPHCPCSTRRCASTPISETRRSSVSPDLRLRQCHPADPGEARLVPIWRAHVAALDGELLDRAAPVFTRIVIEQLLDRATTLDPDVAQIHGEAEATRVRGAWLWSPGQTRHPPRAITTMAASTGDQFIIEPLPALDGPSPATVRPVQQTADSLEDRSSRTCGLWWRARPGGANAGLDERLDHADPEPGGHAGHGGEHHDRHPCSGPRPGPGGSRLR